MPHNERDLALSLVSPSRILEAYTRLNSQAVYVSPNAESWLTEGASHLPPPFMPVSGAPCVLVFAYGPYKIGVILLPKIDEPPMELAPEKALEARQRAINKAYAQALQAGGQLAGNVCLLIGVSPWGSEEERNFLPQAEGIFHIILGAGAGYGFPFAVAGAHGGVLWARPENSGKSVNVINILQWPQQGLHLWQPQANFEAYLQLLGAEIQPDTVIGNMFPE